MEHVIESFIPIVAIIFTFGIPAILVFYWMTQKHKERTKLMDMGLTPQEARDYFRDMDRKPKNRYGALKLGILAVSVGVGLLFGTLLEGAGYEDTMMAVSILICVGAGYLIYYTIINRITKKETGSTSV